MTLNEGLGFLKMLTQRHRELSSLQAQNCRKSTHYYGENPTVDEPTYDVRALDKQISRIAREIRKLDTAIKATNAITEIRDYVSPEDDIFDGPQ